MVVLWPLAGAAVADPPVSNPIGIGAQPAANGKQASSRDEELRRLLDALARQIDEIDANIANLGPNSAAALRFRAASLAAYQRTWTGLTRVRMAAALAEARR
jgi:hypothetical protein